MEIYISGVVIPDPTKGGIFISEGPRDTDEIIKTVFGGDD